MKKSSILLYSLLCFLTLSFMGCKEDEMEPLPEAVPLTVTLNQKSFVMGDELEVTVAVDRSKNESLVANEDFPVRFTAKKTGSGEDVSATLFEEFPTEVTFKKGESSVTAVFKIKKEGITELWNVDLGIFVRGYLFGQNMSSDKESITISDYHHTTVSVKDNVDKEIKEGDTFVLVASVSTTMIAPLDVVITPKKGEEKYYDNLPMTITIPGGESSAEGSPITLLSDGEPTGNLNLTLDLTVSNSNYPLSEESLTIKLIDADKPLGNKLEDERHLYSHPDYPFVSGKNKKQFETWYGNKGGFVEMEEGDPHPNADLAVTWSFLNAMEFHKIDALFPASSRPNAFGNYVTNFLAANNTVKTQETQAVNNDKYSTTTDDGFLRMWGVKEPAVTTGGGAGQQRDYGAAAFYCSKFSAGGNIFAPAHTRIYPGIRIEVRARIRGEKNGMNSAIWLMGNSSEGSGAKAWPMCGEVDILENPAGPKVGGQNYAFSTLHFANGKDNKDHAPSVNKILNNMDEWNIYWFEWRSEDEVAVGINGQETAVWTRSKNAPDPEYWPYDLKMNPQGFKLILSIALKNDWALGNDPASDWDKGFANIGYEDSKTNSKTPRMEIDWVRFYKSSSYSGEGESVFTNGKPY